MVVPLVVVAPACWFTQACRSAGMFQCRVVGEVWCGWRWQGVVLMRVVVVACGVGWAGWFRANCLHNQCPLRLWPACPSCRFAQHMVDE